MADAMVMMMMMKPKQCGNKRITKNLNKIPTMLIMMMLKLISNQSISYDFPIDFSLSIFVVVKLRIYILFFWYISHSLSVFLSLLRYCKPALDLVIKSKCIHPNNQIQHSCCIRFYFLYLGYISNKNQKKKKNKQ